jgi:hypothetical protein
MKAKGSKGPVATSDFTAEEVACVRAALHFLHVRCGTWEPLAKVLRFKASTLGQVASGHKPVTATLVVRLARFAGVGVDQLLDGSFPASGTCPHCGHLDVNGGGDA